MSTTKIIKSRLKSNPLQNPQKIYETKYGTNQITCTVRYGNFHALVRGPSETLNFIRQLKEPFPFFANLSVKSVNGVKNTSRDKEKNASARRSRRPMR